MKRKIESGDIMSRLMVGSGVKHLEVASNLLRETE